MDLSVSGIQSSRTVAPGTNFDIGVMLLLVDDSETIAFSFGVDFDPSVMTVQSADVSGRPAGFENSNPITINNLTGSVRPFDALTLGSPLSVQETLLGRLNVTAAAPFSSLSGNISPGFQNLGLDGILDANGMIVPLGITPGDGGVFFLPGSLTVTAVPEPSTLMLVGSAALGFVFRYRRRKIAEERADADRTA